MDASMRMCERVGILMIAALAAALAGCASMRGRDGTDSAASVHGAGVSGSAQASAVALPAFDGDAGISEYLNHALMSNPGLKAAFSRQQAARERVPQAFSLEDPELTFEQFMEQKDLRRQVSLTQRIPLFGRRDLMAKEAAAEADAALHEFEAAKLVIYDEVNRAFYEYRFLGRAIGVMEESNRLLADLEKVIRAGYEAGTMQFSDLTKAQVEKDRTENELATMLDERRAMSDKLAASLGISTDGPLPWPRDEPPAPILVDDSVLFGMIEDLNPDLKSARSMIAKAEYSEALAKRGSYPDLMVGASFMVMPGPGGGRDEYDTGVTVGASLPLWWGKNSARAREAKALLEAARNDLKNRQNAIAADLRMAIFRLRDGERRVALMRDSLIPRAEQAYEVARRDFSVGKAEFMSLVDARRTVLELKLMHERAAADRELAMAEIGCCIGRYGDSLRSAVEVGK